MKGRTPNRTILIVDEAQDLTPKKLKMVATRIAEDSKIIFLGNVAQIDDSYLTEHTCGVSVFIRAFADSNIAGHITLQRGERSAFATEAEERL
jgi:PhoH-like ATPase